MGLEKVKSIYNKLLTEYSPEGGQPITEQIMEAITFKDPTKLYYFYLDYNFLTKEIQQELNDIKDFNIFSKQFTGAVKLYVHKHDRDFHKTIKDIFVKVRFKNFMYNSDKNEFVSLDPIRNINSNHTEKYVCFRGIIRNTIINKMNLMKQKYICKNCHEVMDLDFNDIDDHFDGKKCTNPQCGSENLEMQRVIGGTTDTQILVIEELTHDSDSDTASINVMVDGDLVNKFSLGDPVIVTGNVRLDVYTDEAVNQLKKKITDLKYYKRLSIYGGPTNGINLDSFIEANYIQKINETNIIFNIITKEEEQKILEMKKDRHIIDKMVQSFASDIYGYDIEKEVLIYQQIGGLGRSRDPKLDNKRGEIHVFFIGDNSTAKTELMKFALGISHRSKLIYAGNLTKAGLCAGAEQVVGGNWVLTMGSAVATDKGLLGIDELHHAKDEVIKPLNEIMENQTTTITTIKSGTFNTRTSIIACANPPNGNRYNKKKTFRENVGVNDSLFDRFDYIGLFRDIPEPIRDRRVIEKVLKSFKKANIAPISREMMAKYIYYMKNQPHIPQFSQEADEEYANYYVKIRTFDLNENAKNPDEQEHVSLTSRQMQTIHRIATARAILLGHFDVEKEDVERAEFIMDNMLRTIGIDPETGKIDIALVNGSKSSNQMTMENIFFDKLEFMVRGFKKNRIPKQVFMDEIKKEDKWKELDDKKLENKLQKYSEQGYIIILNDHISLVNYNESNPSPS